MSETTKIIKEGRRGVILACSVCNKREDIAGVALKKCGRCKLVRYCSVECQRADWPKHKNECEDDTDSDGRGVGPLLKSVDANPTLNHYIQLCIVLEHGIHHIPSTRDSWRESMSTPFVVHIDIGIEAYEPSDWMNLYAFPDSGWDKLNMEGMLQFHQTHKIVRPTPLQIGLWKQGRAHADETGQQHLPIAVVSFVNHRGQEVNCLWFIEVDAISRVRSRKGFQVTHAHTGEMSEIPLTVEHILERMNYMIGKDISNELLLRTKMRASDKELIRDAGRPSVDTLSVRSFRLKILREREMPEELEPAPPPGSLHDHSAFEGMNRAQRRQLEREQKRGSGKRNPQN